MTGSGSRRLWLRRLRWLAALWLAGVGAMGLVTLAIKVVMRAVGLTL
jgi:hypothetical protein